MKQTILSKCFGKMKRVALTLFAALCVGSVWAEEGEETEVTYVTTPMDDSSAGYIRTGLGTYGNEVAVVFTNHTKTATWTAPYNLNNVEFLVVGGGGGGGAESNKGDGANPGAGGGGGGVVTGFANFAKGQEITVTVGAGGNGGKAETNYKGGGSDNGWGASYAGGASKFGVGTTSWVTANGGGRDQGTTSASSTSKGREGSVGGSGGGGRPKKDAYTTVNDSNGGSVASGIDNIISHTPYAKRGGKTTVSYAGAGGGGATTVGSEPADGNSPGNGGVGFDSDITGAMLCYGSGGGGGCSTTVNDYAEGGPGAGDGNHVRNTNGFDALANQGGGGGGGGGGWKSSGTDVGANGGNGGSGIVVFRYAKFIDIAELTVRLADRVYNGNVQTIEGTYAYTVSGNVSATNAGEYTIIVTPQNGYLWSDTKKDENREFTWKINPAENSWTQNVHITITSWSENDEPGIITHATAQFGESIIKYKKATSEGYSEELIFDDSILNEPGSYVVTYYPPEDVNYSSVNMQPQSISFTVVGESDLPPYTISFDAVDVGNDNTITIPYTINCTATTTYKSRFFVEYISSNGTTLTNDVTDVSLNSDNGNLVVSGLTVGEIYNVKVFSQPIESELGYLGEINLVKEFQNVVNVAPATGLIASASYTNNPKKFVISGSINPSAIIGDSDYTKVVVYWALNNSVELDNSEVFVFDSDGTSGAFSVEVEYTSSEDKLYWKVEAENVITDVAGSQHKFDSQNSVGLNTDVTERYRSEDGGFAYEWSGLGNTEYWNDLDNWTSNAGDTESVGYPGIKANSGWYLSNARFTTNAEVDLNGGIYTVRDGGHSLYFEPGVNVILKNGYLGLMPQEMDISQYLLGNTGTQVECKDLRLVFKSESLTSRFNLSFAEGSTNIFSGNVEHYWNYLPTKANTKVIFKDGEIKTEYSNTSFNKLNSQELEINNASWLIKVNNSTYGATRGIAGVVKFRDGVDRQAQLMVQSKKALMLQGTYDFVLSSDREYTHYVEAGKTYTSETKDKAGKVTGYTTYKCNIKVDATALIGDVTIPLMQFTAPDNYTNETMNQMVDPANNYLKVIVDGKEVDNSKYGASLVWKDNILYYQQTVLKVAAITKTETDDAGNETEVTIAEYATLGEALAAATDGATIKVLNDVEITSYLQITKALTLNLNGKSITRTDSTDNSTALFVNAADAIVTITGDGTVTADHAVYVNAGKVIIENGTFSAGTHAVYVINNGHAEIKGGTFSSEDGQYHYVLNEYDATRDATSIVVTGGTFVGFNPANNTAEVDNTNFCADGYEAVEDTENPGTWTVKAKSGLDVTINGESFADADALKAKANSATTMTLPAATTSEWTGNGNVLLKDGEAYVTFADYYTVVVDGTTVTLTLKDTVKPNIAESTEGADDAFTVTADAVTIKISNYNSALNYGVRTAADISGLSTAAIAPVTPTAGVITLEKAAGNSAFYEVVVSDVDFPVAE